MTRIVTHVVRNPKTTIDRFHSQQDGALLTLTSVCQVQEGLPDEYARTRTDEIEALPGGNLQS